MIVCLKVSKTNPFNKGVCAVVGFMEAQVCCLCHAWALLQQYCATGVLSTVPPIWQVCCTSPLHFPLLHPPLAKLHINTSYYSSHSLCIRGYLCGHCRPQKGGQAAQVMEKPGLPDIYPWHSSDVCWLCPLMGSLSWFHPLWPWSSL